MNRPQTPAHDSLARLSALFDELSALPAPAQAARLQALQAEGHPLAPRLARMLQALDGPRTDELLTRWRRSHPPPAGFQAGQRIGPWELLQTLGRGGMAEVWLARRHDGWLGRAVALKLPHALPGMAGAARAQRFERERDILAALRHPNIAALLDAGIEPDGQAWLAIERVEGELITRWCDSRRLPLAGRVALFRQVLLAVRHAHAQLVVHRDLKPANILVNDEGEVRLLDFGIAKLLAGEQQPAEATTLTQEAGRPLTPRYASPEQMRGEPLSTASDVYALGVLLHELLTGGLPYRLDHGGAAELERAIVELDPLPASRMPLPEAVAATRASTPRALRRALAPELQAVLQRALAKAPAQRYSSVDALLADVDRWRQGVPVQARTPSRWFRLQRFVARHPLGVGLGVAVAASLAGLSTAALLFGLQATEQSARALATRDLVLDMFRKADVDQSKGADISARDMLDWGRRRVAELPVQPDLRAELLMGIGEAQLQTAEYEGADRSFSEAAQIYRRLGRAEGQVLALANQAEVVMRLGDYARAARLVAQADAAMPAAPPPALTARTRYVAGLLATEAGRGDEAQSHLQQAASAAEQAWPPTDRRRVEVLRAQAQAEAGNGHAQTALDRLDELRTRMAAPPAAELRERLAVEWERARIAATEGHYHSVVMQLGEVLPTCEVGLGPLSETCTMVRQLRALSLLRLGDVEAAVALLPAIQAEIAARAAPRRHAESVLVSARILASAGRVEDPAALWSAVEDIALERSAEPLPESASVLARLALAEAMLRAGRPAAARAWTRLAHERLTTADARMPASVVRAQVFDGAALLLEGQALPALHSLQAAQREAAAVLGSQHPLTWLYALNMVPALRAVGREEEAQRLLTDGLPVLQQALGADAPNLQRVAAWQRLPAPPWPAAPQDLLL